MTRIPPGSLETVLPALCCVRCGKWPMKEYNTNWDHRGPICVDCWLTELDAKENYLREREREADEQDWG